jgi:hypothetical protein
MTAISAPQTLSDFQQTIKARPYLRHARYLTRETDGVTIHQLAIVGNNKLLGGSIRGKAGEIYNIRWEGVEWLYRYFPTPGSEEEFPEEMKEPVYARIFEVANAPKSMVVPTTFRFPKEY